MNPADRGWFNRLMRRLVLNEQDGIMEVVRIIHEEEASVHTFLYDLIQPTGLMYGFPVRFVGETPIGSNSWTEKDKIKILISEAFLYLGLYYHPPESGKIRDSLPAILTDIEQFYNENAALIPSGSKRRWAKRKRQEDRVEGMIDKRISLRYDWRNFWNSFFHNSLLFFDLLDFMLWKETQGTSADQSILMHRQQLRFDILKIITAAAHADGKVTKQEKELFGFFLESARLPAHRKKQAQAFFRDGLSLNELTIDNLDSWLLKKYFLELAILTVWVNRDINVSEMRFLSLLSQKMGLNEEEMDHSIETIRIFVLQYWDQVHYLTIRQNYRVVSDQMMRRIFMIGKENQKLLAREVKGSRKIASLIAKYTTGDIKSREKEELRKGLLDIIKAIPAYSYLLLPGTFLTLPILFRILPKSILFPAAHREEQKLERKSRKK